MVATRLVQPVLRKTIAKVTTTVLDSGFMVDSIIHAGLKGKELEHQLPRAILPKQASISDISPDHLHRPMVKCVV